MPASPAASGGTGRHHWRDPCWDGGEPSCQVEAPVAEKDGLNDLVPDHGHLVHLFLLRVPQLDRMVHLHPSMDHANGRGRFLQMLPEMPAGHYQIFADIVHATGFPETQIGEITLPEIHAGVPQGDDSSVTASPLEQGTPRQQATLSGGARMIWLNDFHFRAGEA